MKICITLDDVIRAKTKQFLKIYKKSVDKDFSLNYEELKSDDLSILFPFKDKNEYQKFLYTDYPFEIFGEAEVMEKMLDKNFNLWHMSIDEYNEDNDTNIELCFGNIMEFNASIGYTCFFLSKIATRIREFYFPLNSSDLWDKCDVIITANNKLIENIPEGKKCVKINTPYNKECKGAILEYDSLMDIFEDDNFFDKLKNGEE